MTSKRFILTASLSILMAASCRQAAETVIFGTIYTAEEDKPVAEAIAVRDGKYIYVGDKAGAAAFIKEGVTQVIEHSGKGMVMPGCTEGHAHYLLSNGITCMGGLSVSYSDSVRDFMEKLEAACREAVSNGKTSIYGFGWNYFSFSNEGIPTRTQLDAICPDIAVYINDSEGHKGLANTLCLRNAGIIDAEGNVLIDKIRGGEICMDENGKPNGLLLEQAGTYVRCKGIDFNELLPLDASVKAIELSQQMLLENGFTCYMDGWSNYFGNDGMYKAAGKLDSEGKLNILLGMSYEIESSCQDVDAEIAKAVDTRKYTKGHIRADYIKLFMDGTVEGGTGLTIEPYPDGHPGIANWEEEEVTAITAKANAQGLTMHIHTMGDGAVHRAVNSYVNAGTKQARNTVVHVRNMLEEDFPRIADNDIVAVSGILWHALPDEAWDTLKDMAPLSIARKFYPIKSYFDNGAVMTSHSDYPAVEESPFDPFGIMEIAVTGRLPEKEGRHNSISWWPEELITREQAFQALTINGAFQMHCENERGSIKVGKMADFILTDKDVFECPVTDIHSTKVVSTWFEGKKVYQRQ